MKIFLFPILLCLSVQIYAQEISETNSDILLLRATEAYQASDFRKSLELTKRGLELAPDYHDIRILQIRNLWALENFSEADKDLDYLLENAPEYEGFKFLLIQRTTRFDNNKDALIFLDKVESYYPGETAFRVKRAQLYLDFKQNAEARNIAMDLLQREDLPSGDRYILETILRQTVKDEIGINYQYIGFSKDYIAGDPWHSISGEYQHNFGRTATIARATYSERNTRNGVLYEIEAYPVINKRLYTFINLGYSTGDLFPDLRGSLSLFYNFAKVFEAELGGRVQKYEEESFYTGIVGLTLYHQKLLFNARTFLGPEINGNLVQNYQGNVRYYYSGSDNYLFLRAGSGISPDEQILSTQALENPLLEAFYGTLGVNFSMKIHHIFNAGAGILQEDLSHGSKGTQVIGSIGYRYRF